MIRKFLYMVTLETNGSRKAVLEDAFNHKPTVESLRAAHKERCDLLDKETEEALAAPPSDDSSEDEIAQERRFQQKDHLANLAELISAITPAQLETAIEKGEYTLFLAGCRIGHLTIGTIQYFSEVSNVESPVALSQSVGVTVIRNGKPVPGYAGDPP